MLSVALKGQRSTSRLRARVNICQTNYFVSDLENRPIHHIGKGQDQGP